MLSLAPVALIPPSLTGRENRFPIRNKYLKSQKITKMKEEIKARAKEILSDIADKVSESYLKRAEQEGVESNALPKSGVFGTYKVSGSKDTDANGKITDYRHLRMTVKGSDNSVSVSNLKLIAPAKGEPIEFGVINREGALKGKKFLRGKAINPQLAQYGTAELVAYLEGKHFTAEEITCQRLPYKDSGYDDPTEKDLRAVTGFKVTITD